MLQESLARRYGYRGPFDPQLLEDLENPYRFALLAQSLIDMKDDTMGNALKYIKSLINVHGVAVCRAMGASKVDRIFASDEDVETHNGRVVKRTVTMPNGTIIKVLGNG